MPADRTSGPESAPAQPWSELLASWQPLPDQLERLRTIHSAALNRAAARRCAELEPSTRPDLPERAARTTWTTPQIAFAQYVELQRSEPTAAGLALTLRALERVCATPAAPAPDLDPARDPASEWELHGLRVLVGDYERDGRSARTDVDRPALVDLDLTEHALAALGDGWPEMAATFDLLVRQIVWYRTASGPPSGTVYQAYGALFVARDRGLVSTLERLVHETTHLELMARFAVDRALANPDERDSSPFRTRPRPLSRVLHAAVVAVRVIEACERCAPLLPPDQAAEALDTARRLERSRDMALEALERSAVWTPLGALLFDSMRSQGAPA